MVVFEQHKSLWCISHSLCLMHSLYLIATTAYNRAGDVDDAFVKHCVFAKGQFDCARAHC